MPNLQWSNQIGLNLYCQKASIYLVGGKKLEFSFLRVYYYEFRIECYKLCAPFFNLVKKAGGNNAFNSTNNSKFFNLLGWREKKIVYPTLNGK